VIHGYHATDWLTALGTVGAVMAAVGIAVWSERLRRVDQMIARRRQPRLALQKDNASIDSRSPYQKLRLAVINEPGHEAAHEVSVAIEFIDESGLHHTPLNHTLPWSGYLGEAGRRQQTIPAGARRHIDIGGFVDKYRGEGFNKAPCFKVAQVVGAAFGLELDRPSIHPLSHADRLQRRRDVLDCEGWIRRPEQS
jgi:hypothetical protein